MIKLLAGLLQKLAEYRSGKLWIKAYGVHRVPIILGRMTSWFRLKLLIAGKK